MQLFQKQLQRSQFLTEIKKTVLSVNQFTLTFLLHTTEQTRKLQSLADVMVLVPKTLHQDRSSLFTKTSNLMLQRTTSQLVSWMTLHSFPYQFFQKLTLPAKAQQAAYSGVLVLTVLLVLTRTPSRSLVTTQTFTLRLTSTMIPKNPVVLHSLTYVLVKNLSVLLTLLRQLTSSLAIMKHTSTCMI